ncbi:hypothetical protein F2Q68_00018009 [Brassica cretica]|uniref:Uncharacterized protein n=1 Tax=Brassica cretica TaxID=69181 RepID=A0A8S9HM02_BRACR|nr:hypothetical protein F2Q68_00018009 [Brassica cretica]
MHCGICGQPDHNSRAGPYHVASPTASQAPSQAPSPAASQASSQESRKLWVLVSQVVLKLILTLFWSNRCVFRKW